MKISCIFLVFIIFPFTTKCYSQNYEKGFVGIDILPILPYYTYAPRWTVSYHHRINNRYYIGLKFGYANEDLVNNEFYYLDSSKNYQSLYIGSEALYLIKPNVHIKKSHWKSYFWADLYFLHHTETRLNSDYIPDGSDSFISFESADYDRKKYGVNLGFGLFVPIYKNTQLLFKGGLGPRVRDVKFENVEGLHEYIDDDEHYGFANLRNYKEIEGIKLGLNTSLELKLIYRF